MMKKPRLDMSDWVVHFVHDPNPEYSPVKWCSENILKSGSLPYVEDLEKNARFSYWEESDASYGAPTNAVQVLMKILHDGHIRSGWSFRTSRATIYDPRSACCFTEMPLYALLQYASEQKDRSNVSAYGICLLKDQFYRSGGRPVIYGTTGAYIEDNPNPWPVKLPEASGLMEKEQYRFVPFDLARKKGKPIDWSHEREWRWCDSKDEGAVPGLPIWLEQGPQFTQAIVLVKTRAEAKKVLRQMKSCQDSLRSTPQFHPDASGWIYDLKAIEGTSVVALDEVLAVVNAKGIDNVQISDIPFEYRKEVEVPVPTAELKRRAAKALMEAISAAQQAAREHQITAAQAVEGHWFTPKGFANVVVHNLLSSVTQAFIEIKAGQGASGIGYYITAATSDGGVSRDVSEAFAAARAALAVFQSEFPDEEFSIRSDFL